MGREWDEIQRIKSDAAMRANLESITARLAQIEEGNEDELPLFQPQASVISRQCVGEMSYIETLFLSAEQIERWCNVPYQSLGVLLSERFAEDNETIIRGAYVRSDDLPPEMTWQEFQGLRKVRFYRDTAGVHSKHIMDRKEQIGESQGNDMVSMLQRRAQKREPDRPHPAFLADLQSLRGLQTKANALEAKKKLKEEELAKRLQEQTGGDESPEVAEDVVDEKKLEKLKRFSMANAEAAPVAAVSAAAAAARVTGTKKRGKQPPAPSEVSAGKVSASVASKKSGGNPSEVMSQKPLPLDLMDQAVIKQRLIHDPAMKSVALYLQAIPDCLMKLSIPRAMEGQRLGNSTAAAMLLVFVLHRSCEHCNIISLFHDCSRHVVYCLRWVTAQRQRRCRSV